MSFDSNEYDQIINAQTVEYLGSQAARAADHQALAILTFRLQPANSFAVQNFCFTQAQVIRLRDDLDSLLTRPDSWLFTGKE